MMIDESLFPLGLVAANALLLAATAFALSAARREIARLRKSAESPAAFGLPAEPYDDLELRRMFDRRCTMLEQRLERLVAGRTATSQARELPAAAPRKNESLVDYAMRMAAGGATLDDLVRGCGLNRGEAQLLLRLNASRRAFACHGRHGSRTARRAVGVTRPAAACAS